VLAAGTAIIGKVGIDQTTDGTTNRTVAKISQSVGENVITSADGGLVTLGAKADTPIIDPTLSASQIALLKGMLKQLQGTGTAGTSQPVSVVGSLANTAVDLRTSLEVIVSPPVVGVKTVVATTAEVFAGASAKANRRTLNIKNEDAALRFRIGPLTVNQQTGFPVEPGSTVKIKFDPSVATLIYAISEGASLQATVWEE